MPSILGLWELATSWLDIKAPVCWNWDGSRLFHPSRLYLLATPLPPAYFSSFLNQFQLMSSFHALSRGHGPLGARRPIQVQDFQDILPSCPHFQLQSRSKSKIPIIVLCCWCCYVFRFCWNLFCFKLKCRSKSECGFVWKWSCMGSCFPFGWSWLGLAALHAIMEV